MVQASVQTLQRMSKITYLILFPHSHFLPVNYFSVDHIQILHNEGSIIFTPYKWWSMQYRGNGSGHGGSDPGSEHEWWALDEVSEHIGGHLLGAERTWCLDTGSFSPGEYIIRWLRVGLKLWWKCSWDGPQYRRVNHGQWQGHGWHTTPLAEKVALCMWKSQDQYEQYQASVKLTIDSYSKSNLYEGEDN